MQAHNRTKIVNFSESAKREGDLMGEMGKIGKIGRIGTIGKIGL
jgi:hypothetical protein